MLIGIPGSGKTTWINENINKEEYLIICPDMIRKELTGDISNLSLDKRVWQLAKERVSENLKQGSNVILDATNVNGQNRRAFIENLPSCKLKTKLFFISPEEAKERVKLDIEDDKERSHVPYDVIDRMYEQFISQSTPEQLKKEGFDILED